MIKQINDIHFVNYHEYTQECFVYYHNDLHYEKCHENYKQIVSINHSVDTSFKKLKAFEIRSNAKFISTILYNSYSKIRCVRSRVSNKIDAPFVIYVCIYGIPLCYI